MKLVERWKRIDDRHRLDGNAGHPFDEIYDMSRILAPGVRVVHDARVLVGLDLIAVHDPPEGRLSVHDVAVGVLRYAGKGQCAIHYYLRLVFGFPVLAEAELLDTV